MKSDTQPLDEHRKVFGTEPFDENTKIPVSFGDDNNVLNIPFHSVMKDIESFVKTVRAVTHNMKQSNFATSECREELAYVYSGDLAITVNEKDNLYELPYEFDSLFVYIDRYQRRYDLTRQKEKLMSLTTELWQLLPDFYRGHEHPFQQPENYDPQVPYPSYLNRTHEGWMKYRFWNKTFIPLRPPSYGETPESVPFFELERDFEIFVREVQKATEEMRKANFDAKTCEEVLNYFYKNTPYASKNENYYHLWYTNIGSIERATRRIGRDYNLSVQQEKIEQLKSILWKLLPDFYKGHKKAPEKSFSYNPNKPFYISLTESSVPEAIKMYLKNPPKEAVKIISVQFENFNIQLTLDGTTYEIYTNEDEPPFIDLFWFIEQILRGISPAAVDVYEENLETFFYAQNTDDPETVFIGIYGDIFEETNKTSDSRESRCIVGIFNKKQLATAFIHALEAMFTTYFTDSETAEYGEDLRKVDIDNLKKLLAEQ